MKKTIFVILFFSISLAGIQAQSSQQQSSQKKKSRRPVLIKDDQTLKEEVPEGETIEIDPAKAKKSFEIGEYYLKSKHYDAALMRFRQAIQYDPEFDDAKWKFIQTLEKKKDWQNLTWLQKHLRISRNTETLN